MITVTTDPSPYGRETSRPVLTGKFRHNPGYGFRVGILNDQAEPILMATASIIQAAHYNGMGQTGALPAAQDGDLIEVDGQLYRIRDDRRGYDPRLEAI